MCGFVWDDVAPGDVGARITAGTDALARLVGTSPDVATLRPTAGRWSMLEYGAHVRDVLLMMRDRFVAGAVADNPAFTPMYRDHRVDLGLYAAEDPATVAGELPTAASLLVRLLARLSPEQLDRPCQYGFPEPSTRTLQWMAAQAVHEVEHHLRDVEENLTLVGD